MQKFEYKTIEIKYFRNLDTCLKEHGLLGWKLISVTSRAQDNYMIYSLFFKKSIKIWDKRYWKK